MLQQLPIGEQSFLNIRRGNMLYVDKTEHIHRLVMGSRYVFLSRPRRFGKSLTLATIDELFNGKQHLFKGLWIEEHWDWTKKSPVVHLSFSKLDYQHEGLESALMVFLDQKAAEFGFALTAKSSKSGLTELIQLLAAKHGPVVLLIDEYDKPLIDYLEKDQLHIAKEHRAILKTFYSGLKDKESQEALRFFMITGVSKFSQVSIFSDLNYLSDLTLNDQCTTLTGYTQRELEDYFQEWLVHLQQNFPDLNQTQMLALIRQWYNGYSWDAKNKVYNPFSILQLFNNRTLQDYWFKTGTPTFLINLVREQGLFNLNQLTVDGTVFESYDLENMDSRALLFQTGYLTIVSIDRQRGLYTLDYPNREVELAMHNHLIGALTRRSAIDSRRPITLLEKAFTDNDLTQVVAIINALLKEVPSHLIEGKNEHFYHALVHLHFRYLGLFIESEPHTSDGRMDAVVQTDDYVYILEFKLDQGPQTALNQIKKKGYAEKYRLTGKTVVGVGIAFESGKKAVAGWRKKVLIEAAGVEP
jgi:Predicted AAA-ATPase/PD-(D/E)XK nuclease superfamily